MTRVPVQIPITGKDKTKAMFSSVGRSLKGLTKSIFSMKTALVGVAGVAGFGLMIRSSLKTIDANKKLADRLGLTTQQLAGFELASVLAGESVETVQSAFQKLSKNIFEAGQGLSTPVKALEKLRLTAKQLQKLSFDEQIKLIADRMSQLSTQSEKLGVASQLLGRAGMVMVNMLDLGSEGLSKMQQEALDLGIALSTASSKQVEDFNDSLSVFKFTLQGVANSITAEFAPAMQTVTDKLTKFMKEFLKDGKLELFFEGFYQLLRDGMFNIIEFAKTFIKSFESIALAVNKGFFGGDRFFDSDKFKKTNATLLADLDSFGIKFNAKLFEIQAQNAKAKEGLTDLTGKGDGTPDKMDGLPDKWRDNLTALSQLNVKAMDVEKQFDSLAVAISTSLGTAFESIIMGTKKASDAFKDLGKIILAQMVKIFVMKQIVAPFTDAFGSLFGGGATKPQGEATGGSVRGGRPYMVGERGQELFVPSTNGTIIPNKNLGSSGGITIEQNINFATGIQASVRSEVLQLLPAIAQVSKGAVQDARLRT